MLPRIFFVTVLHIGFIICTLTVRGQQPTPKKKVSSPFDGSTWGVVLDHSQTGKVRLTSNVIYTTGDKRNFAIDIYLPPLNAPSKKIPAIVFLNASGDTPGQKKLKEGEGYKSWAKLVAAHGFAGILMESKRGGNIQMHLKNVFEFLQKNGSAYNIDTENMAVFAGSSNVGQSVAYLMSDSAHKSIKAAVLYYGSPPQGPFRKDLPLLFVVAEGDVTGTAYATLWGEVLKNKAPWTLKMASGLPHAFDVFSDTDDAKRIIKETITFWKNHLESIPSPKNPPSQAREAMASIFGNDYPKAASILKQWLETNPDDFEALRTYANVLRNGRMNEEAETVLRKLHKKDSSNMEFIMDLGSVLYAQKKWSETEGFLKNAIFKGLKNTNSYVQLGNALYNQDKIEEGVGIFKKMLESGLATNATATGFIHYSIARGYARLKNHSEAIKELKNAIASGYAQKERVTKEEDFKSLLTEPEYQKLVEGLK